MASIKAVKAVIEVLETAGADDGSYFDMDHDVLYVPWFEEEGEVAEALAKAGCHWEDDAGSWAMF